MLPQQSGQRMSHCHNAAAASTDVILGGPVLSWPGRQCDAPKTHLVVSARQNSAPSGCRSKSKYGLVCHSSSGLNAAYANLLLTRPPGKYSISLVSGA